MTDPEEHEIEPLHNYDPNRTENISDHDLIRPSEEISERIWRTHVAAVIPFGFVLIAIYAKMEMMETFAVLILSTFGQAFLRLIWIIVRSENLYRINSCSKVIPGWSPMPVTYKIVECKKESIHSISEFSAIEGGEMITSLLRLCENTWIICVCLFIFRVYEGTSNISDLHIADWLAIIAVFGLLIIGIWDLNPYSRLQRVIHLTGAGLWSVGIVFAYGFQTNFKYPFYILAVFTGLFFVTWNVLSYIAEKYDGKDIKRVHRYSVSMLVIESLLLWQGTIALTLYIYFHDQYHSYY